MRRPPLTHAAYVIACAVAAPLLHRIAARKLPPARRGERAGRTALSRPQGALVWIHAVSLGEVTSVLGVAGRLAQTGPVLITTTTPGSADLVAARLPPGCLHQFAPLDTPRATRRFLDHWRPCLLVLVESELWPHQISAMVARGGRVALISARLSDRALARWANAPRLARRMVEGLSLVLAQDRRTLDGLVRLGLPPDRGALGGSLKSAAIPLPVDPAARTAMQAAMGNRPVWLAASTHPGEDALVAQAHRMLLARHPGLLLIIAPRHPRNGPDIKTALEKDHWRTAQRSTGALPDTETDIYIADTLGEMGLWVDAAKVAFIGGSLADHGGHNPLEALAAGAHVVTGPHIANVADLYTDPLASGAAIVVQNVAELAYAVDAALRNPDGAAPPLRAASMEDRIVERLTALRDDPQDTISGGSD